MPASCTFTCGSYLLNRRIFRFPLTLQGTNMPRNRRSARLPHRRAVHARCLTPVLELPRKQQAKVVEMAEGFLALHAKPG